MSIRYLLNMWFLLKQLMTASISASEILFAWFVCITISYELNAKMMISSIYMCMNISTLPLFLVWEMFLLLVLGLKIFPQSFSLWEHIPLISPYYWHRFHEIINSDRCLLNRYNMGVITTRKSLSVCENLSVSSFCR